MSDKETPEDLLEVCNLLRRDLALVALAVERLSEAETIALVEAQLRAKRLQDHFRAPVETRAATIPGHFRTPRSGHTGPLTEVG